jgi:nuclear pore complex protein Nup188
MTLETTRDIILPGGAVIPSGTAGSVITPDDAPVRYASWYTTVPTLGLLIEILRVAAGMRSPKDKAAYSPLSGDFVHLSVAELGIESDIPEILLYGLSLIRALLRASTTTANEVLAQIPSGAEPPSVLLLSLSLSILDGLRQTDLTPVNVQTAVCALDIIRSLAVISDSVTWTALRHTAFLGALGKRRSGAADLIVADSKVDQHDITLATLRLVQSIVVASSSTVRPVDITLRNSLHLGVSAIWADFTSWRYANPARKFEIASMLYQVFGSTLAHPLKEDGSGPTLGAEYLIETFITSASVMTYRPLIETLTQAPSLIDELAANHRIADARLVVGSLENSLAFLSTLVRVATKLGVAANALPNALFALPVVTASGKKLQLVDHLFDLAVRPSLPSSTKLVVLRSLRTYLEAINADSHRPSLAALLRDANTSCAALSALTAGSNAPEVRAAVWDLLATIIGSQPGCTSACIGQEGDKAEKEAPLAGLLRLAVDQVLDWYDVIRESPRILSSVLNYFNAIMLSPSAGSAVLSLRDQDFWTAVQEVATRIVPAPPTFQLSMHAEDFASRIREYAYDVQAKANATTLLAAELNSLAELPEDQPETKAQSLVMGMFRKGSQLVEAAESAMNSYCNPPLHEDQSQRSAHYGVNPATMQTPLLPSEREYGRTYLYGESKPPLSISIV